MKDIYKEYLSRSMDDAVELAMEAEAQGYDVDVTPIAMSLYQSRIARYEQKRMEGQQPDFPENEGKGMM
jgi:surface antigen